MELKFKFDLYQYVKLTDEFLKCNKTFPEYPCKIDYRFFDGKNYVYVIGVGKENKRCVLEGDLEPYIEHGNGDIIHQIQKTICELQDRIANLEFKIDNKIG